MEKIQLIIPEDFRKEIDEKFFEIKKVEEYQMTDSNYNMNLSDLLTGPQVSLLASYITILMIPKQLDELFNFITKAKKILINSKSDERIILKLKGKRYVIDKTTPEESYQEIRQLLDDKLAK